VQLGKRTPKEKRKKEKYHNVYILSYPIRLTALGIGDSAAAQGVEGPYLASARFPKGLFPKSASIQT